MKSLRNLTYIKSIFRISPLILARKAVRKAKSFIFNDNKRFHLTNKNRFINFEKQLNKIFLLPDLDSLRKNQEKILRKSLRTLNNELCIFGSLWIKSPDQKINWQKDYISGFEWSSNLPSRKIVYGNVEGADIKVPWEIGRMQYLPLLAMAYSLSLTDDKDYDEYLIKFKELINDFDDNNPIGYGTQWISSMEVAIRACNIICSYYMFCDSGVIFQDEFKIRIHQILFNHGVYIYRNPEWNDGLRGNHYLACLCGLIFISLALPDSKQADTWLKFAKSEMINEIDYQFNEDGSNFEDSTAYHFLSVELVLSSLILMINRNKLECNSKLLSKIQGMYQFCDSLIKPDGSIDLIGDCDSGRLFRFHENEPKDDFKEVLSLFQFFYYGTYDTESLFISIFSNSFKSKCLTEQKNTNINKSKLFPDFGLYVNRRKNYFFSLKFGKLGQKGKGGHSHNDRLSITLSVLGRDFFVDNGSYSYTSDHKLRNQFRSVLSHNTLVPEGQEQNEWLSGIKDDLFWMIKDRAKAKCKICSDESFTGVHYAYGEPHSRELTFTDNRIEGKDVLNNSKPKLLLFNLHPNVEIVEVNSENIVLRNDDIILNLGFDISVLRINKSLYSPSYGLMLESKRIEICFDRNEINWNITFKNN